MMRALRYWLIRKLGGVPAAEVAVRRGDERLRIQAELRLRLRALKGEVSAIEGVVGGLHKGERG